MWIAKKDDKIIAVNISREELEKAIIDIPNAEIEEVEGDIVVLDDEIFIKGSPEYKEKLAEIEHNRIQELFMTRSDFFDGTIRAFGATRQVLEAVIANTLNTLPIPDVEKLVAISNFENALNFYRKHTLFTLLSGIELPITPESTIVITSEQWDKFFDETHKRNPEAYKELLPTEN